MKIVWATPTTRGIHPEVVRNIVAFDLDSQQQQNTLILNFPQSSLISMSRNNVVRDAIAKDADWVLMVDDDTSIKSEKFFKTMLDTAFRHNAPIVGLPVRLGDGSQIIYNFAHKKSYGYKNWEGELPTKPMEVDTIGTGVMLINIKWLKEHWPKAPWFHVTDTETGAFPEDWNFCEQIKAKGGKIIMEPRIKTVHWKPVGLTWN